MAGRIFVNYRRDDSASHALNVAQYLEATFGKRNVFLDIDRMRAGQSFPTVLKERLSASKVMLAIIGPSWLELKGEDGQRRLDDPSDWVRLEIATALSNGMTVIPVLVGGARLPRKVELPPDLQALTDQHAVTVTTNGFRNEMAGLARDIRAIPGPLPWGLIGGGAAAALVVVLGGWTAAYQLGVPVWVPFPRVSDPGLLAASGRTGPNPGTSADLKGVPLRVGSDPQGQTPAKATADKMQVEREAKLIADAEQRIRDEIASKRKADEAAAVKKKADDDGRKAAADAEAKRLADLAAAEERRKAQDQSPGRVFRDCNDVCPEMVVVPAGTFTMGSNDYDNEKPTRTVTIRQAFAVGKFEVTFAEWEACVAGGGCQGNRTPSDQGWGKGRRPVINVSWNDAKEYVAWLSRKTGQTYRLLTEAEWEYAARAGTTTRYSFGDTIIKQQAQYSEGSFGSAKTTVEVGRFAANRFGLHDMHGNVWEWVEDCWHGNYSGAPSDASARTTACTDVNARVLRGGSWFFTPDDLRSADRSRNHPGNRFYSIGFRVGRVVSR